MKLHDSFDSDLKKASVYGFVGMVISLFLSLAFLLSLIFGAVWILKHFGVIR